MIVRMYGHSDDLVEVETLRTVQFCDARGDSVHEEQDEFTLDEDGQAALVVKSIGGSRSAQIRCVYEFNGTWTFTPIRPEEGIKLPPWTFTIDNQPDHDYSTRITIDTGDDLVEVVKLERPEEIG